MERTASASLRSCSLSVCPTLRMTVSLSVRIAPCGSCAIARKLKGAGENLLARHHLVGQTDAQRVRGADRPAGDDEFHGAPEPDHQRQAYGQAVSCNDVPAALERAEEGGLRNDPDVGEERSLRPAATA